MSPSLRDRIRTPGSPGSGGSDAPDRPPGPRTRPETRFVARAAAHSNLVRRRGRLASVSVAAAMAAGAWVGLTLGVTLGALFGAIGAWVAGAIVGWQRDLSFTLGVAQRLLPLGDQTDLLRQINASWYLTVPLVALGFGLLGALVGALLGGILAAAYNRSPRKASVDVEVHGGPDDAQPD